MSVTYRGSRDDLRRLVQSVVDAVTGRGPDPSAVALPVLTRGAVALLSQIQGAFVQKARGGVGSDGIRWAPLSRKTIAARRTTRAELRSLGVGGRRVRGLLTPAEDARWRAIYRSTLAQLTARGIAGAASLAAQRAWAILKSQGAKTKLDVLGGRTVEIGRDTGALLASLTPGVEDSPARVDGQVLDVTPGRVVVGSSKPYALRFHAGNGRGQPARPLWPTDGSIPGPWADAVSGAVARGILNALVRAVAAGERL